MILHNRKILFVGKVATIETPVFNCVIVTAKDGLFKGKTTMIQLDTGRGIKRVVGKVVYASSMRDEDRFAGHDLITACLNEAGDNFALLSEAMDVLFAEMKRRGIASETINVAV